MSSYTARLQLPGRTRIPMSVNVDVSGETLTLIADDKKIGVWRLSEIEVNPRSDGFHIRIDGEEAILAISEAARFASEVQLSMPTPKPQTVSAPVGSPALQSNEATSRTMIGGLGQESELAEARRRINDLREALRNPSIPPAVVFSQWLALLKVLNSRHGQGAIPTPLFFRLNTELLDLMPVPTPSEPTRVDSGVTV